MAGRRWTWRAGLLVIGTAVASASLAMTGAHADLGPSASAQASSAAPWSAEPRPGQGATDTMSVGVNGGSMTVSPATVRVTLVRRGARLVGTFGPIVVTDGRGTLVGWTLSATTDTRVRIAPQAVVSLTGNPDEAVKGSPATGTAVLMSAPPEGGGGEFAVSGTLDMAADGGLPSVTLTLHVA